MIAEQTATATGQLVVLNGKKRGTELKLRLPVTLIGSSDQCDVRLSGPGMAEVHAIITHTAVGPVLRAIHTDQTLVNGVIVSTRLLKNQDELTVGPCVFRLQWNEEELIPLSVAPPEADEPIALWVPTPEAEWSLQERETALQAQEQYLSELYQQRQCHLSGLIAELASKREEIRQLREYALGRVEETRVETEHKQQQAKRLAHKARQERVRVRTFYQRFLKRLKNRRAQQEADLKRQHDQLQARQEWLERELDNYKHERTRREADAAAYHARLKEGWDLLVEGQRRLLADRQAAEQHFSQLSNSLQSREAALAHQESLDQQGQHRIETRVQELLHEIQRLEQRAGVSRQVVQKLEVRRQELEAAFVDTGSPTAMMSLSPMTQIVSLEPTPERGVEAFLNSLALQERELTRQQLEMQLVRQELQRHAGELHDQRIVVAEQLSDLLVARQSWQSAQLLALQELEDLARQLDERERLLELRQNDISLFEEARRKKEDDLLRLRERLETWQLQLTTHEAELNTTRANQELEVNQRRDRLTQWEESLTQLRHDWTQQVTGVMASLQSELTHCVETREELERLRSETEDTRTRLLQDAARVGEQALAVEQAQQELFGTAVGKLAERRVRVFRKMWERHFQHAHANLTAMQQAQLSAEQQTAAKLKLLATEKAKVAEEQQKVLAARQELEQAQLQHERQEQEAAQILSLAEARASKSQHELLAIRGEVDGLAAKFIDHQYTALPGWDGPRRAA